LIVLVESLVYSEGLVFGWLGSNVSEAPGAPRVCVHDARMVCGIQQVESAKSFVVLCASFPVRLTSARIGKRAWRWSEAAVSCRSGFV
jgi:hypothetical protein